MFIIKMLIALFPIAASFECGLCVAQTLPVPSSTSTWHAVADVGAIGVPLIAGLITLAEHDTDGLIQFGETGLLAEGTALGLKQVVKSTRPNGLDTKSFPSNHTTAAFFAASYLEDRYGWEVGLPAHVVAVAVAVARVKSRDHRVVDVLAGAAIGEISAYLFTHRRDDIVKFFPWSTGDGAGVAMVAKF